MWPGQSYASIISIAIVEPKMYNSSANGISSERVFERVRPGCASGSKWLAQQAFVQIHAIFKIHVRFPILDARQGPSAHDRSGDLLRSHAYGIAIDINTSMYVTRWLVDIRGCGPTATRVLSGLWETSGKIIISCTCSS